MNHRKVLQIPSFQYEITTFYLDSFIKYGLDFLVIRTYMFYKIIFNLFIFFKTQYMLFKNYVPLFSRKHISIIFQRYFVFLFTLFSD